MTAVPLLHAAIQGSSRAGYYPFYTGFLSGLAQAQGAAGHLDEGLATIESALLRAERIEEACYVPGGCCASKASSC